MLADEGISGGRAAGFPQTVSCSCTTIATIVSDCHQRDKINTLLLARISMPVQMPTRSSRMNVALMSLCPFAIVTYFQFIFSFSSSYQFIGVRLEAF